jgi:hypothetical protein
MPRKYSVIKTNQKIRQAIIDRIDVLKLTQQDVINDAALKGYKLPVDMISRYLKHGDMKGSLREDQIIWLATRYGVFINLTIGSPEVDENGRIKFSVKEYNEEESLRKLKLLFPGTK